MLVKKSYNELTNKEKVELYNLLSELELSNLQRFVNYFAKHIHRLILRYWIYYLDKEIIGCAITKGRYVSSLIVKKEYRRMGFGKRLLQDIMKEKGKVILHPTKESKGFYNKIQ